jgi:hypothetical protein
MPIQARHTNERQFDIPVQKRRLRNGTAILKIGVLKWANG